MVEYWRERAHFLLYLGYVWTHLIEPILYLLNFCAQEEAAATLAMADRTLRVTPRGRLLTLHDAWERHQTDANLEHVYRFDRAGLRLLYLELGFPSIITLGGSPTQGNGSGYGKKVTGVEVLLILLDRLHQNGTLKKLGDEYGLQQSVISNAINYGLAHVATEYGPAMKDVRRWVHYVPGWAAAVETKTNGVFPQLYGFIDVICQRFCRPSSILVNGVVVDVQRPWYCGYKGYHVMKWQGVESPCGTMIGLDGPFLGTESDADCLRGSGILLQLGDIASHYNWQFGLYGDPAYPRSPVIYKPYDGGAVVTRAMRLYNYYGARARVVVEWHFGDMRGYWKAMDNWKLLRMHRMPVSRYAVVTCFLTNCLNCHHCNRVEKYFDCRPPGLAEYLAIMSEPRRADINEYPRY